MLGYDRSADEITWEMWRGLMHPEDRMEMNRLYRDHLLGKTDRCTGECRLRRKDGEYRWFSASSRLAFGPDGSIRRYAGILTDITDRRQQEGVIAELAYYDNLTGLPNRTHLSPLQFLGEGFLSQIRNEIRAFGLPASMIAVEITESLLMENFQIIAGCLQALRDDGCHIYLDDFGTGYSSLNYLNNLPIDVLKIDKSFLRDVMVHPSERKLLRAIIGMAHSLRLKVVAEGVETEEQRAFLLQSRCNYMQGYLFSRPLSQENALALLAAEQVRQPRGGSDNQA